MQTSQAAADRVRGEQTDSGWKIAYFRVVNSPQGPDGKLRSVLFALISMSDPLGRCWASQESIANQAGVKERTLRRYLDELVISGWLKKTPMTWRTIALEQAHLGFQLPMRDDDGIAPDVLVVCRHHQPAAEVMELRIVTEGQIGREQRPKMSSRVAAKLADDPRIHSDLTCNQREGDPRDPPPNLDSSTKEAWDALCAAYHKHYPDVYGGRATSRAPLDAAGVLGGNVADLAVLLQARLRERGGPNISFSEAVHRIADTAMCAWLKDDGPFLIKCKHAFKAIRTDLPGFGKNAVDKLLRELAPNTPAKTKETSTPKIVSFAEYIKGEQAAIKPADLAGQSQEIISRPNELAARSTTTKPTKVLEFGEAGNNAQNAPLDLVHTSNAGRTATKSSNYVESNKISHSPPEASLVFPHTTSTKTEGDAQALIPEKPDEAAQLLEALGTPRWCDLAFAGELLSGPLLGPQLVKTIRSLYLDENTLTTPRIRAKVFRTIYGGSPS